MQDYQFVTGDSWYSSRENLQFLKNKELGFLMGVAKNRKVTRPVWTMGSSQYT
jgi:hypothetical protein